MPKATLTFDLPQENSEYNAAVYGEDWKLVAYEFSMYMRNLLKYGHKLKTADEALEHMKDQFWSLCKDRSLDPWED